MEKYGALMTLFISVNRAQAVYNAQNNTNFPIYEIRTNKNDPNPRLYNNVTISCTAVTARYDPENPLISGAFAWIEVEEK